MKVKNKSNKVITIGLTDILPDKVVDLDEKTAKNPVVQLFLQNGFLVEIPGTKTDEEENTPEKIAAKVKKMKKDEIVEKLTELNIEFNAEDNLDVLRPLLVEALV